MNKTIASFLSDFNMTKKRLSWYTEFVVVVLSDYHANEERITKKFYLHKYDSYELTKVSCNVKGRRVTYTLYVK